jgi:hypothetical protein
MSLRVFASGFQEFVVQRQSDVFHVHSILVHRDCAQGCRESRSYTLTQQSTAWRTFREKILNISRATDFSSVIPTRRQRCRFHRPLADSFVGNPSIHGRKAFAGSAKPILFTAWELIFWIVCFIPLWARQNRLKCGTSPRISAAADRRQKVPLKVAVFLGSPAVAAGIPAVSVEIREFRRKSNGVARVSGCHGKFPVFS